MGATVSKACSAMASSMRISMISVLGTVIRPALDRMLRLAMKLEVRLSSLDVANKRVTIVGIRDNFSLTLARILLKQGARHVCILGKPTTESEQPAAPAEDEDVYDLDLSNITLGEMETAFTSIGGTDVLIGYHFVENAEMIRAGNFDVEMLLDEIYYNYLLTVTINDVATRVSPLEAHVVVAKRSQIRANRGLPYTSFTLQPDLQKELAELGETDEMVYRLISYKNIVKYF